MFRITIILLAACGVVSCASASERRDVPKTQASALSCLRERELGGPLGPSEASLRAALRRAGVGTGDLLASPGDDWWMVARARDEKSASNLVSELVATSLASDVRRSGREVAYLPGREAGVRVSGLDDTKAVTECIRMLDLVSAGPPSRDPRSAEGRWQLDYLPTMPPDLLDNENPMPRFMFERVEWTFSRGGRVAGSDGCNDVTGRWQADEDGAFQFQHGGSSLVGCSGVEHQGRTFDLDSAVEEAMETARSFVTYDDRLVLSNDTPEPVIVFRRAEG